MIKSEDKKTLQKQIELELINIPEGQRVHIDKDALEQLMFETFILTDKNIKIKIPIWSGEVLRKIDLSEVSFEDVSWEWPLLHWSNIDIDWGYSDLPSVDMSLPQLSQEEQMMLYKEKNHPKLEYNDVRSVGSNKNYVIDYSMTNARIDFSKSFERKCGKNIWLGNYNFSGLDLSNTDFQNVYAFSLCNFSNCIFGDNIKDVFYGSRIHRCNFTNVDLSNIEINMKNVWDSIFTNSRISLTDVTDKHMKYLHKSGWTKVLGCFINDKEIDSEEKLLVGADKTM